MNNIKEELIKNQDLKYKAFNDRIINTNYETIGVRMDVLKRIAKEAKKENKEYLINDLSNDYYEYVLLKGLVIANSKDIKACLEKLDTYLDLIDSWAICDTVVAACKVLKKDLLSTLLFIDKNIHSKSPFRVRFSFVVLLNYFIKKEYLDLIYNYCDNDKNNDYYVMMAKAWLISICYVKYPKETLSYLKISKIDNTTYNKAISKICDSYKVNKEDKINLKKMKKMSQKA